MVAIYVLKLVRGKYYVGLTRRNIDRVLDHLDGDGASWTRKYPPVQKNPVVSFQEGLKESDEDRITLKTMAKYGVRNVRGGQWYRVKLSDSKIRELENKVRSLKKVPAKKTARKRVVKGYCIRCETRKKFDAKKPLCGDCYDEWAFFSNPNYKEDCCHKCGRESRTTIERPLCNNCRPKSGSKAKNPRCKGRTLYGTGPRCKLTVTSGSDYCRVHAPYYPKKRRRRFR